MHRIALINQHGIQPFLNARAHRGFDARFQCARPHHLDDQLTPVNGVRFNRPRLQPEIHRRPRDHRHNRHPFQPSNTHSSSLAAHRPAIPPDALPHAAR